MPDDSTDPVLLARCEAHLAECWRNAGDESLSPEIRYQYAWGAMDWELERMLLLELARDNPRT